MSENIETPGVKPGDRVFAVLKATNDEVVLLGFGHYVGDKIPPRPMGAIAWVFGAETWEECERIAVESGALAEENKHLVRKPNPKIVLDDGRIVWGAQCWWGPEAGFPKLLGDRKVVNFNDNIE